MKALIVFLSLVAVVLLSWRQYDLQRQLEAANARIAQLTKPKTNWVDETNRKWKSPLGRGSYDNRSVFSGTPTVNTYPVPAQATYYTDFKGRYWIDSAGTKNYVP